MKLEELLRRPEGKTLEFKRDLSSPRGVVRTLVAFANSAGGRVVVGVEDRSRRVRGVSDTLAEEERLANLIADSIEPRLLVDIETVPWRKQQVLVAHVHPSQLRPHHVKSDGPAKGTYVRLGSTNRLADNALIGELRRQPNRRTFDEEPVLGLDSEAIDFAAVSQCFGDRRSLRRQDLVTLGLVVSHQGRRVPTAGGAILFARDRLSHFPDAWIQVGRFAGADKSELADRAELRDYPVLAIEDAIAFVERNTRLGAEIGRVRRRDVPTVPPVALREALINAVVHADYAQRGAPTRVSVFDDRVEIENPGVLLPGLTVDELRDGVSRLRNHVIGRVFKELGLIEQWGSGVQRMTSACVSAGLPEPELEEVGLRFRVTLRTVATGPAMADAVERRILSYLDNPEGRSTAELAAHIKRTNRATQNRLAALADRGLVVAIGSGPRDPRRRWYLAASAGQMKSIHTMT